MKVVVRKKTEEIPVEISTEFIKLDAAIKFAGAAETGAQAKNLVQEGGVTVNGDVCTVRGRKLRPGDQFGVAGQCYVIHAAV